MHLAGKPLIVIVGPTAVGKTWLSIQLGRALGGEIVNADSRQIYQLMDIGTAKPTANEQAQVKHHLIDLVKPDEQLTLAQYQRHAYAAIDTLHHEKRVPILAGGTGQYISAVTEGWSIPEVAPNMVYRQQLEDEAAQDGGHVLHQRLAHVDPIAAEKIHPNNLRRVIRALEVYHETGHPISTLQEKKPPPYHIRLYRLTMARDPLYERADRRFDQMIDAGFVHEVSNLLQQGYNESLPAMSAIGYHQLAMHLRGELSQTEAVTLSKQLTHDFIRRQFTWFRKYHADAITLDIGQETFPLDQLIQNIRQWLTTLTSYD